MLKTTAALRVRVSLPAILGASVSLAALLASVTPAAAQDQPATGTTVTTTNQIQEVTVTAERRTQNQQKVAASVAVVRGADLVAEGRISTQQILESVPNVVVSGNAGGGDNPNGNITIRGVQETQGNGGLTTSPPTTATYVDDIYQGIGGDFDIDRVEVLRGPQGTLYGRSATGGVVAFHTVDPVIGKFTGNISGEYATADLRQVIAGVNIPLGPVLAARIAGREFDQNGYYNGNAGATREQEARVKVLYQPASNLRVIAGWTIDEHHNNAGGPTFYLSSPNDFNFNGTSTQVYSTEARYHQYWGEVSDDVGFANLTYIGAFHDYDSNTDTPPLLVNGGLQSHTITNPLDQFHTEEVRLASEPGSRLTWIVGANFYANFLKTANSAVQESGVTNTGAADDNPNIYGAPIYATQEAGRTFDYGLFTEETYPVLPTLRITGGARLDETQVDRFESYLFNGNLDEYENSLNPADELAFANTSRFTYRNFTYKLRAEYDLTPANMVYAMVSSGFLPGDQQLSPNPQFTTTPSFAVTGVKFALLPFQQERLTAYEIGSKNRFLDNTLQLNADAYYYDYAGYHELANTSTFGPPSFNVLSVPVRIVGAEFESVWRVTPVDRLTLNMGLTDAEITSFPMVAGTDYSARYFLDSARVPDVPLFGLSAFYDHTITMADGATIVPRAEILYTSAENLTSFTQTEAAYGEQPYAHQGGVTLVNLYATLTSADTKYSVTGYIRNVGNTLYKTGAGLQPQGAFDITGTPGAPRTGGVVVTARF